MTEEYVMFRLRKRAEIRRQIKDRKSVKEGKPDRISDLLEEAANEIERIWKICHRLEEEKEGLEIALENAHVHYERTRY